MEIPLRRAALIFYLSLTAVMGCSQSDKDRVGIGGPCEDCDLMFAGMPEKISWQAQLSPPDEKGEPMVISGRILRPDGKTPASGIVLYVYHTDAKGKYSPSLGQVKALRHGHLRGWVKTGADGRYEFRTIRPASYPDSDAAQHIHPIIYEPGKGYYWIDEYLFEDDPLLSAQARSSQEGRGGPGIITLEKKEGVWYGSRDIELGKNIPGYK
jgi:protocatechuate 3,4-dioxygenase beta subunit